MVDFYLQFWGADLLGLMLSTTHGPKSQRVGNLTQLISQIANTTTYRDSMGDASRFSNHWQVCIASVAVKKAVLCKTRKQI